MQWETVWQVVQRLILAQEVLTRRLYQRCMDCDAQCVEDVFRLFDGQVPQPDLRMLERRRYGTLAVTFVRKTSPSLFDTRFISFPSPFLELSTHAFRISFAVSQVRSQI